MRIDTAPVPGLAITGCVFCGLLAVIHIYIFMLESILWRSRASKTFKIPQSTVDISAGLAANQGFYNLLLAVGFIWGLAELNGFILLFFSAAVFTAGILGAITSSPRILFVQVIPAFLSFIFVAFGFIPTNDWKYGRHPVYLLLILIGAGVLTAILSFVIKKRFLDKIPVSPSEESPAAYNL